MENENEPESLSPISEDDENYCRNQQELFTDSIPIPSQPSSLLEVDNEKGNNVRYFDGLRQLPKEIRNIIAGGFAGMIAKSIVAPFDRIKILY
mmetsp:Transcript_6042/g.5942  ORF Transcript_6042/g.5942 Transcript_6042/m.5942 type:complete len:93 (+) Transcript_6042:97-375(+)